MTQYKGVLEDPWRVNQTLEWIVDSDHTFSFSDKKLFVSSKDILNRVDKNFS